LYGEFAKLQRANGQMSICDAMGAFNRFVIEMMSGNSKIDVGELSDISVS